MVAMTKLKRMTRNMYTTREHCRTQYQQYSFLPRTIRDWNDLPQEVIEAKTIDTFVYSKPFFFFFFFFAADESDKIINMMIAIASQEEEEEEHGTGHVCCFVCCLNLC